MTVAGVRALRAERDEFRRWVSDDAAISEAHGWFAEVVGRGAAMGDLDEVSERALAALADMQVPVAGDLLRRFGDEGQHPTHLWADGLVHRLVVLRCFDLGAGRLLDDSLPSALAWFVSALPQVAPGALHAALERPVCIRIEPPITLWRVGESVAVGDSSGGDGVAGATIEVDGWSLLRFGTGRSRWVDEDVRIDGDEDLAVAVLDAMRI